MALDAEDLKAINARIDGAVRVGVAAALEGVAAVIEGHVVASREGARLLRELAHDFVIGETELGAPVKLALVREGLVDAEVVEDAPAPAGSVQTVDAQSFGNRGLLRPRDAEEFSLEMHAWLDLFDDRHRRSVHFVEAVNEAAAAGRSADEATARLVADRISEMAAAARPVGPEEA